MFAGLLRPCGSAGLRQSISIAPAIRTSAADNSLARLLHNLHYTLRTNHKRLARRQVCPRAILQFISSLRQRFERRGLPMISVDTEMRERPGNLKNASAKWDRSPVLIQDHGFCSDCIGVAITWLPSPRGVRLMLHPFVAGAPSSFWRAVASNPDRALPLFETPLALL